MNVSKISSSVIEDFYEHGLSYADLAQKYGRHDSTCRKTIIQYRAQYRLDHQGEDRPRKIVPTTVKRACTDKPLSLGHSAIGLRIHRHMLQNGLTATGFGMSLNPMKGPSIVNAAVRGVYDWTYSELQGLCAYFDVPMERLTVVEANHAFA